MTLEELAMSLGDNESFELTISRVAPHVLRVFGKRIDGDGKRVEVARYVSRAEPNLGHIIEREVLR